MDEKKITIELTYEELKRLNYAMFALAFEQEKKNGKEKTEKDWELSGKMYEYYYKEYREREVK